MFIHLKDMELKLIKELVICGERLPTYNALATNVSTICMCHLHNLLSSDLEILINYNLTIYEIK